MEKNSTSVIKSNYLGGITSERHSPTMSCSPSIICCKENQVHPLLDHQSTLCSGLITWACDFYEYLTPLWEKAIATHSSTLAWTIPWMEEPGRLQSMGSLRVGHDWVTSLSLFTFMHWRRKWQLTPLFLPGESQGRGSLVGCHLWGQIESDTNEAT